MNMSYLNMPFQNPDELFTDALYNEFICKSIKWVEDSSCGGAFAANFGSYWESAYMLSYLIDVSKIIKERNDAVLDAERVHSMCDSIVNFLIRPEDQLLITNWENNIWDTSVIANSLLYYVDYFGVDMSNKIPICQKMQKVLPAVIKWLYDQFTENEAVYSQYSFSVVDYSRILYLFIYVCKSSYRAKLLQPVHLKISDIISALHGLAMHIDKSKVVENVLIYSESTRAVSTEEIVNWGDCFVTAEICEAMSRYLLFLIADKANKISSHDHDDWVKHMYSSLKRAMRWVEAVQSSEGMWGAHDDTIRCLSSYIATISALKEFERSPFNGITESSGTMACGIGESDCEDHKVFKAIRWLFDPKQRFSDGSYLHTSFLSVFFFETFVSIYKHWNFSDGKTIYKIYDEVFWMSPARTTQEKGQVVELEIEREGNRIEIKNLKYQRRVFIWSCITIAVISLGFFLATLIGFLTVKVTLVDNNADAVALVFTLVLFAFSTIGARYFSSKGE